jgi:predicted nucleotide-binding protein
MPDKRKVFVVHGRSLRAHDAMFEFLRAISLKPMEWSEAVHSSRRPTVHISDILESAFSEAQAILVLFTGDDTGRLRKRFQKKTDPPHEKELTPQPRLNVVFEAGMAFAYCKQRTILLQIGQKMRPFTDIAGIYVHPFVGTAADRRHLRKQLELAGCAIKPRKGWSKAGDFKRPIRKQ